MRLHRLHNPACEPVGDIPNAPPAILGVTFGPLQIDLDYFLSLPSLLWGTSPPPFIFISAPFHANLISLCGSEVGPSAT